MEQLYRDCPDPPMTFFEWATTVRHQGDCVCEGTGIITWDCPCENGEPMCDGCFEKNSKTWTTNHYPNLCIPCRQANAIWDEKEAVEP